MRQRKVITLAEKAKIIEEYLTTEKSSRELGKKYGVSYSTIILWSKQISDSQMKDKKQVKEGDGIQNTFIGSLGMEIEIKRLRKELEDKDRKIQLLEKTISKASEIFGVDIKKKSDTK